MTPLARRGLQDWLLILTGLFVIVWAVVRAVLQSVTIDEAFTYLYFAKSLDVVVEFNTNNHVLNSLLMWIVTQALGTSSITVRLPALLGGVLYVCVCYFLCKSLTSKFSLRLPLFICLTCNPFILDYMVAARGYSLANAFLVTAIAVPVWYHAKGRPSLPTCCALASVALGLSFTANFSFAFVDAAAFLGIATWAIRRREGHSIVRIVGFCALPGIFVAFLICGYTLTHWQSPRWQDDLTWGAHSMREMRRSLVDSSLYQLDPRFRGSLYDAVMFLQPRLLPLLEILCACQLVVTRLDGSWRQDARVRWLGRLVAGLLGITALTVGISWLAFRYYALPLPVGRTGIYLVPLVTLLAGLIAAIPAERLISRWLRRGIATVLICLACYFLLCLRLSYFREYKWDADVKDVYSVMARLNHTYGVKDAQVTGLYVSALNYYRDLSKQETFPEFTLDVPELSSGRSIYVLDGVWKQDFINQEKLVVVYRGKFSEVVVAVKPNGAIPSAMIEP